MAEMRQTLTDLAVQTCKWTEELHLGDKIGATPPPTVGMRRLMEEEAPRHTGKLLTDNRLGNRDLMFAKGRVERKCPTSHTKYGEETDEFTKSPVPLLSLFRLKYDRSCNMKRLFNSLSSGLV